MDEKRQEKRAEQAENAYAKIRAADDISSVSRASGLSEDDIRTVKDHIFFDSHVLYDEYGRFPADYDMAVAWNRLTKGEPENRDITLLRHELEEAKAEKAGASTLSDAHMIANTKFNWEAQLEKEKGEEGEDDGLLQADKQ